MLAQAQSLLPAGYEVALRRVEVGEASIPLYQVADPNALSDSVDPADFAEDERFPYWAEIWPSGVALARFVLRRDIGRGLSVLELGCGLGLAGVAAALVGAQTLFTDFEPDALAFACANHALNLGGPGRTRLLDWRRPPADLQAPVILASDVLYECRFLDPFLATLRRLLPPGGTAYVAEPGRTVAEGIVEGLDLEEFERALHLEEVEVAGRLHAVWIHEVRRPARGPVRP